MVAPFTDAPLVIGPVSISWLRIFVLVVALLLILASYALIHRTKLRRDDARDVSGHGRQPR